MRGSASASTRRQKGVASPAGIAPFFRGRVERRAAKDSGVQTESPTIGPRRSLVVGVRVAAFSRRNLRS